MWIDDSSVDVWISMNSFQYRLLLPIRCGMSFAMCQQHPQKDTVRVIYNFGSTAVWWILMISLHITVHQRCKQSHPRHMPAVIITANFSLLLHSGVLSHWPVVDAGSILYAVQCTVFRKKLAQSPWPMGCCTLRQRTTWRLLSLSLWLVSIGGCSCSKRYRPWLGQIPRTLWDWVETFLRKFTDLSRFSAISVQRNLLATSARIP